MSKRSSRFINTRLSVQNHQMSNYITTKNKGNVILFIIVCKIDLRIMTPIKTSIMSKNIENSAPILSTQSCIQAKFKNAILIQSPSNKRTLRSNLSISEGMLSYD